MNSQGQLQSTGPKPYEFIWTIAVHGPKPYEFIGQNGFHGPKPYELMGNIAKYIKADRHTYIHQISPRQSGGNILRPSSVRTQWPIHSCCMHVKELVTSALGKHEPLAKQHT